MVFFGSRRVFPQIGADLIPQITADLFCINLRPSTQHLSAGKLINYCFFKKYL